MKYEQRTVCFGETSPGPFRGIISRIVEERRGHFQGLSTGLTPSATLGRLEGLDACEAMQDGEVIDFDLALTVLQKEVENKHIALEMGEVSVEECIRHNNARVEIESCFNILRVAHCAFYEAFYEERYGYEAKPLLNTHQEQYLTVVAA